MCEKTVSRELAPGHIEELSPIGTGTKDDLILSDNPPFQICHRDFSSMPRVKKFSGDRYICPKCGRVIKMDPNGRITVIKTGEHLPGKR